MNKFKISFLLLLTAFVFACAGMKDKNAIEGTVDAVELGKDGYTAKIKTSNNKIFYATVSIVNVGGPENYKVFKVGEQVSVTGDLWKTDTENHITVRKIITAN